MNCVSRPSEARAGTHLKSTRLPWVPALGLRPRPGHASNWCSLKAPSLVDIRRVGPLIELDIRAPLIGDEVKRRARTLLGIRAIELHAIGFKLLDEGLQIEDVEADVVEHATL